MSDLLRVLLRRELAASAGDITLVRNPAFCYHDCRRVSPRLATDLQHFRSGMWVLVGDILVPQARFTMWSLGPQQYCGHGRHLRTEKYGRRVRSAETYTAVQQLIAERPAHCSSSISGFSQSANRVFIGLWLSTDLPLLHLGLLRLILL